MSCSLYVHNNPQGDHEYISGTTCTGEVGYWYLSYGESMCMMDNQPIFYCGGIVYSGSCLPFTPTPTPTSPIYCYTITSGSTIVPYICPSTGELLNNIFKKITITIFANGVEVTSHPSFTFTLSNGSGSYSLVIPNGQSSAQYVWCSRTYNFNGTDCIEENNPDWYLVSSPLPICVFITPTPTITQTPTNTLTPTPTITPTTTVECILEGNAVYVYITPTPTVTSTVTPTVTETPTQTPTVTQTPTNTETPTQTPTNTITPTVTETPTNTPTNTETPTQTPTLTQTPTPSGVSFDADAASYLNSVIVAGGTLNSTISAATDTLFTSLKSNNLYNKMFAFYPLLGATASSMAIMGKRTSGTTYDIQWFGGWSYDVSGATGNGSNTYAQFNISGGTIPNTNSHFSVYGNKPIATANGYDLSINEGNAAGKVCSIILDFVNTGNGYYEYTGYAAVSGADSTDFAIVSRNAAGTATIRARNGIALTDKTEACNVISNTRQWMLGCEQASGGGKGASTDKRYSWAGFGEKLTAAELLTYQSIINTFQTSLGRNTY